MITVRLYATLAPAPADRQGSRAGPAEFRVETRPGLRVEDVLVEKGVPLDQVNVVILNEVRVGLEAPLTEGDQVSVFPALSGG